MGRNKVMKWTFVDLVKTIVATLLNKYDMFLIIEGNTGTGKSTLAFHIAHKVAVEFKRLYKLDIDTVEYYYERVGRKARLSEGEFVDKILALKNAGSYKFSPKKSLIYSQDDMIKKLTSWNEISIPDELVAVAHNRDFYGEKQKEIVKLINLMRDHENLTISCIPSFAVVDTQIKGLTKMKITVKKRGVGIIHTPNQVVYNRDKWDFPTNIRIEQKWVEKKITNPDYSKLTTFRGLIKFPPLSKAQEIAYQQVKNEKRVTLLREDMGIETGDKGNKPDPFDDLMERLQNGAIKNGAYLEGFADSQDMTMNRLQAKIKKELVAKKKNPLISSYYAHKNARNKSDNVGDVGD